MPQSQDPKVPGWGGGSSTSERTPGGSEPKDGLDEGLKEEPSPPQVCFPSTSHCRVDDQDRTDTFSY